MYCSILDFNIGLNIGQNIAFNIGFNIGFSIGFNMGLNKGVQYCNIANYLETQDLSLIVEVYCNDL